MSFEPKTGFEYLMEFVYKDITKFDSLVILDS